MLAASTRRLAILSRRIYRALLIAYPIRHRAEYADEMAQVFADLCRDAGQGGLLGIAALWWRVLIDLVATAIRERSLDMERRLSPATLAGGVLLIPTLLFLFIMFTRFVLGIEGLYNAWDRFYMNPTYRTVNWMLERVVVLAPLAAFALAALPALRFHAAREDGTLSASLSLKASTATMIVIALCLLVIAVIGGYGFVENFQPRP